MKPHQNSPLIRNIVENQLNPRLPPDWRITRATKNKYGLITFEAIRLKDNDAAWKQLTNSMSLRFILWLWFTGQKIPARRVTIFDKDVHRAFRTLLEETGRFPYLAVM